MHLDRPDVFVRTVHPHSKSGRVVLERKLGKQKYTSLVPVSELLRVAPRAFLHPDISFSISRFLGKKILLNFDSCSCLYVFIPMNEKRFDLYAVISALQKKGIQDPTFVLSSGTEYIVVWQLDEPINKSDFYKVFLFQKYLMFALKDFRPLSRSLDIASTIPLPGTINSKTNTPVVIERVYGQILSKSSADVMFGRSISFAEKRNYEIHALALQELLALFSYRVLTINARPHLFKHWVTFIGLSLRLFCTREQLFYELKVLVLSLEQKPWVVIKDIYNPFFAEIASRHNSFTNETIMNLAYEALEISKEEVEFIGLYLLAGEIAGPRRIAESFKPSHINFGQESFVPVERLLMVSV